MATVYGDILRQVVADIKSLSLTGISNSNVYTQKVATDRKKDVAALPAVIVAPFGSKVSPSTGGTNTKDEIEYPVLVATLAAADEDQSTNLDRELTWHESILSKFIHQRLTGVTSVLTCRVDPKDVFDPNAFFGKNLDVGGLILRFISRETRG
jgi:hypothetical protein